MWKKKGKKIRHKYTSIGYISKDVGTILASDRYTNKYAKDL